MKTQPPYSCEQVLENLRVIADYLDPHQYDSKYPGSRSWVRGVCRDIIERGIAESATDADLLAALRACIAAVDGNTGLCSNDEEAIRARTLIAKATKGESAKKELGGEDTDNILRGIQ